MLSDERYLQIEPNLFHFRVKYAAILRERPADFDISSEEDTFPSGEGALGEVAQRYYEYIEEQLEDVEGRLKKLPEPRQ